jgi:hypothetical protein
MNPDELDALQRDGARLHGALRALLDASPTGTLDGLEPTPRKEGTRLRTELVRRLHILHRGGDETQRAFAQDTRAAIASEADDDACFDLARRALEHELAVDGWDAADDPTRIVALAEDLCIVWMDGKVSDAAFATFDQRWKLAHAYHGRALRRVLRMNRTPLLAHLPIYTVAPPRDLNSSPYEPTPEPEEANEEVEHELAQRWLDNSARSFFALTRRNRSGRLLVSQLDGAEREEAATTYGLVYREAYALVRKGTREHQRYARHVLQDFNVLDEHDVCFERILGRLNEDLSRLWWDPMEMGYPIGLASSLCAMIELNKVSYDLVMRFNEDWNALHALQGKTLAQGLECNNYEEAFTDLPIFKTPKGERLYPW